MEKNIIKFTDEHKLTTKKTAKHTLMKLQITYINHRTNTNSETTIYRKLIPQWLKIKYISGNMKHLRQNCYRPRYKLISGPERRRSDDLHIKDGNIMRVIYLSTQNHLTHPNTQRSSETHGWCITKPFFNDGWHHNQYNKTYLRLLIERYKEKVQNKTEFQWSEQNLHEWETSL